jgi:hypothetical protein
MIIFTGVAVAAPLGATMKISKYKMPVILALSPGDVSQLHFVIRAMLILSV